MAVPIRSVATRWPISSGSQRDGDRYELLEGVLLLTPAPSYAHQLIVSRLQFRLTQAMMAEGAAHVVSPGAIAVAPKTQLEPDIQAGGPISR
jgi:hypothetical protein